MSTRRRAALVLSVLVVASCGGNSLPDHPSAHRVSTTTTTSTTTTSTTTTTTTVPPVPVPGPVKVFSVCTVPNGVSQAADGSRVFCVDRKTATAKPYANGRLRWTPPG